MTNCTYEDAVRWMRAQSEYTELVRHCYLDEDNIAAAKRFSNSEEFLEVAKILKIDRLPMKPKVLDLGCGNGIASYAFATVGCKVISVDPDVSKDVGIGAVARLRDHVRNGSIIPVRGAAESLPFLDNTFDIIYERQALHHFSNLIQGLTECARILKPSGLLFATREHIVDDIQQLEQFLSEHVLHQKHGGENAYPLKHYTSSFRKAGLTVIRKIGPMDSVINHYPASNADINQAMHHYLTCKIGNTFSNSVARVRFTERMYRRILSIKNKTPGRLYSFLCTK